MADGTRKREVCDWWLQFIESRVDEYLKRRGVKKSVIPENYTDFPPKSLDDVALQLRCVREEKC